MFDRLSHGLVGREMDDAVNVIVLLEDGESVVVVAQIDLVVLDLFSRYFFYSFEDAGRAADVIVYTYYLESVGDEVHYRV
jgi:hypothetical protein